MTPAAELRAAALKIRAIASAVPDDDWYADGVEVTSQFFFVAEIRHISREKAADAAKYFATWHPGVAKVVADWLDLTANCWDIMADLADHYAAEPLKLARAINGEPEASATQPMPAAAEPVLTGEVTSPYGPCSGLTPDLRNNTCTNFAAEYVSYPSTTAGLTVGEEFTPATEYRRLCTPCTDAAPGRISRRPLTTAPGGYPVERA